MSIKKPLEDYVKDIQAHIQKSDLSSALSIINDALIDYPSNSKLYINGGNIHKINGDLSNAEIYFKKSLLLYKSKEVLNNLSVIELENYNYQKSIDYAMNAIEMDPSYADAYYNAALSFERIADYSQAKDYADKSYKLSGNIKHLILLYRILQNICDWKIMDSLSKDLDENIGDGLEHPFLNISRIDNESTNYLAARSWAKNNEYKIPIVNNLKCDIKNNKMKIGYICGELRNHPTYHLIRNLFKNHSKKDFDIYIFSYNHDNTAYDEIKKDVYKFIDLSNISDEGAVNLISDFNIDILIDLSIIITNNRLKIISSRPAKKIISYLGYPGTSGYDFYDYIITDKIVTPIDQQKYYSEKFLYLPNTYQVNSGERFIKNKSILKKDHGLPENSIVFSCFNQSFKIDEIFFKSWISILKTVQSSYLWILEDNDLAKTNLIKYAELYNIGPERLIFAPRIDRESHLERIMLADIALDTRVYNGHTTTTDALKACVPVVTLLGKHFASRVSSSLLMSIGLEDLITYDIQEYEEKIIELSTNEIYFKEIKEKLSNNEYSTKFYDVKKFTHELESSLKSIFKN